MTKWEFVLSHFSFLINVHSRVLKSFIITTIIMKTRRDVTHKSLSIRSSSPLIHDSPTVAVPVAFQLNCFFFSTKPGTQNWINHYHHSLKIKQPVCILYKIRNPKLQNKTNQRKRLWVLRVFNGMFSWPYYSNMQ